MAWPYSFSGYPDPSNPYGSGPYPPPGAPGLDPFSPMFTLGAPGMGLPPMPGTSSYNAQATPTYLGPGAPYSTPGSYPPPPGLTSSPSYPATSSPSYPANTSPYSTTSSTYPSSYNSTTSPYSTSTLPYSSSTYPTSTYGSTSTYGGTSTYTTPGLTSSPSYPATSTPSYPATSTAPYSTPSSYTSGTSSYSSSSTYGSTPTYTTPSLGYSSTYTSSTSSNPYSFSDPYSLPSLTSSPYSLPSLTSTPSTYNLPTMSGAPASTSSPASTYNSSYSLPSTTMPSYSLPSTTMPSYSLPSTTLNTGFSSSPYSLPSTTTPSYLTTPVSTYSTPSTSLPATTPNLTPTTTISPVQAQLLAQHTQKLQAQTSNTYPQTTGTTAPSTSTYNTQPTPGTPTTYQPTQPTAQTSEVDKLRMEKLRLQQKENERLEEQLRKEREAQEKARMEMEIKRQEEAKMKFLQLQQQKMEEEKRKREAQRKIEEQQKLELDKRQRELELKAQEVEKIKTPVSSPTPVKPAPPMSSTASAEVTDTFFGSLIETSKSIASNCKRLSTLIMEQYDIVIQEGSAGRSLMLDLIAVVDGTLSRMIGMLNNNVMNIEDNMHDSIRLAASNLNGTVQALIGCVKNVSDVQKAGSIPAEERTKQMRQHNIAVSYAIKNLVEELQKLKVAERADPHAAKLLSAGSLEEAEQMSMAVTATQNAIDEVRIAQMPVAPPRPNQPWSPSAASPKRRLDTQARLNIMNAPSPNKNVKFTEDQIKKISVLQRRLKSWLVRRRMAHTLELMRGSDEMKQTHHRFRVLSEIMETEASYMNSLEICKKFFLDPLRAAVNTRPVLSAEDIKTIFSSMEMILGFTVQVKSHLEARMKQWPAVQKLGDIFKDLAPAMKIYADYVNKFDAAMEVYKERIQKQSVVDFLRECMTRANTRLDLPSFLIMPVQRMPRYQLLLKELLKFTPESHVDHQNLKEAADAVTEVNVYINRKKQEQDNRLKIVALQEMIKSTVPLVLVAPHRLFVRQGPLFVKRNNETTPIACVVFMFSDLLIVTTQVKSVDKMSFTYVDKLNFGKCDLADLGKTDFKITEDKKVITFTTSSPEEQRGWVKELRETIETVKLHSQLDGDISDTNNFKEGFVLLSATYGQLHKPRHCIDVTNALQNIIKEQGGASLTLNADTKSKLPGFSDPSKSKLMPGSSTRKKNSLMIVFSANGQVRTRTFGDADPVNLDANTP